MVPDEWKARQPRTEVPGNTKGEWVEFGLKQTSKLDTAEDRQQDTLTIVGQCDKLNAHR